MGVELEAAMSLDDMDFYLSGEAEIADIELGELKPENPIVLTSNIDAWGAEGKLGFDGLLPQADLAFYVVRGSLTISARVIDQSRLDITAGIGIAAGLGFKTNEVGFTAHILPITISASIEDNE